MEVGIQPQLPRLPQRPDDILQGPEWRLLLVLNAVLGTQGPHQRGGLVHVVPGHGREKVVLDLEAEVPTEPVIEEGLFHVAGGCQLAAEPVEVGLSVNLHDNAIHLCDSHKPVALQEPDKVKEKDGSQDSIERDVGDATGIVADGPGQVHPVLANDHGHDGLVVEVQRDEQRWPDQEEVLMLVVVRQAFQLLLVICNGMPLAQHKNMQHVHIRILVEHVWHGAGSGNGSTSWQRHPLSD